MGDKTSKCERIKRSNCSYKKEEELIFQALKFTANCGYPMNRKDVLDMVQSYLKLQPHRISPFKDNRPGPDWARNFEKRWENELS